MKQVWVGVGIIELRQILGEEDYPLNLFIYDIDLDCWFRDIDGRGLLEFNMNYSLLKKLEYVGEL